MSKHADLLSRKAFAGFVLVGLSLTGCGQPAKPSLAVAVVTNPPEGVAAQQEQVAFAGDANSAGGDWLHWRGPEQNGVSREKDLPDQWSPDPNKANNNLIWKAKEVGCRSTPLIQGKHVYVINAIGEGANAGERVMCFDADTGKVIWEHRFGVFF